MFCNNSLVTNDIDKNEAQTFKQEDCKSSSKTKTMIPSYDQDKRIRSRKKIFLFL